MPINQVQIEELVLILISIPELAGIVNAITISVLTVETLPCRFIDASYLGAIAGKHPAIVVCFDFLHIEKEALIIVRIISVTVISSEACNISYIFEVICDGRS